jgi:hypothetical protein
MAAVPTQRPGARQLADAVHDAVPGARLPRNEAASVPPPAPRVDVIAGAAGLRPLETWRRSHAVTGRAVQPRRGLRLVGGALAGLAAVGGGLLIVMRGSSSTAASPAGAPSTVPISAATAASTVVAPPTSATRVVTTTAALRPATPPSTVRPMPTGGRSDCPALPGPLSADVDGDGCAEAIRYVAGVVEAGGLRWSVGEPDDVVAVGDWSCSGTRALAVLRPRTGEVFTFTGWATAGHEVQAPLLAQVPGAQTVRAADLDADGCNELVVERTAGAPAVLRAPRLRT